jgi:hypothetical protein
MTALTQRINRMEALLEKLEHFDVLTLQIETAKKDIESIKTDMAAVKTLPARFIWALVLSFAAGVGGLILELIRK